MKRLLDVVCTLGLLLISWPLILIMALLIRIKLGSPVIFRQQRPGLKGEIFTLYKFRTMTDRRDATGNLLPDGERLTTFGKLLRSTSLDELPELWNILRGDMSLVGPRPLLVSYLGRYSEQQKRRHEVRPGLTGWAQVNGRNATSWEERLSQDVWYVDNHNLWLDFKILWFTLGIIFSRTGIHQDGHATMPEFGAEENSPETSHPEDRKEESN